MENSSTVTFSLHISMIIGGGGAAPPLATALSWLHL